MMRTLFDRIRSAWGYICGKNKFHDGQTRKANATAFKKLKRVAVQCSEIARRAFWKKEADEICATVSNKSSEISPSNKVTLSSAFQEIYG